MEMDQIRRVFEKGSVAFFDNNISIFYVVNTDGWVTQSISDKLEYKHMDGCKLVFEEMLRWCDSFALRVLNKGRLRIDFNKSGFKLPDGIVWFLPLGKEAQPDEIKEMLTEDRDFDPSAAMDFAEKMRGIDFSDPSDVSERMNAWLDGVFAEELSKPIPKETARKWPLMLAASDSLGQLLYLGSREVINPNGEMAGLITYELDETTSATYTISGKAKEAFLELVALSDSVTFEIGAGPNSVTYVNISFGI